jgi:2-polyprenyl-3-methyl-5-hydroxy-6-metoxy-1,4-benzoquinol methylase
MATNEMIYLNKVKQLIKKYLLANQLEGNGQRVDILYKVDVDINKLDMYQKSHYRRYEFARKYLNQDTVCGDFACGTGYGTVMLAQLSKCVVGIDINAQVIKKISNRYKIYPNVKFVCCDLLAIDFNETFNTITSFETLEHFNKPQIYELLKKFKRALKPGGLFIFSTPYRQEDSEVAIKMGFHKTFFIDESMVKTWMDNTGFVLKNVFFQNYITHEICDEITPKDFMICTAVSE